MLKTSAQVLPTIYLNHCSIIDRWLLTWLREATFGRRDFFEDGRGAVRLMHPLPCLTLR